MPAWCAMGDYYLQLLYSSGHDDDEYEAIIKKAMKCYRKATEIDPEYGYAWHQWGYACANMHDYKNAIKYYTKAAEVYGKVPGQSLRSLWSIGQITTKSSKKWGREITI